MSEADVARRMREDWNRRAREDARYYVAFGRRGQDDAEFVATAVDVARALKAEIARLEEPNLRARRALEIGCGPGRIIQHLLPLFGEIHGVDVSDEMIALGREALAHAPHVHLHVNDGASLNLFADQSFDFVYSYAVFQHIPSKPMVLHYLEEACRVLKPGGVLRCQFNSLQECACQPDTWCGVSIRPEELAAFAWTHQMQLLALEGPGTQYLWMTLRKPVTGWRERLFEAQELKSAQGTRLRRITNAISTEPLAPSRGPFAAISLWLEEMPSEADLNTLAVTVGDRAATLVCLGAVRQDGLRQLVALLPEGLESGLQPVRLYWMRREIAQGVLRVIPPGPRVPRVVAVTDGINYLDATRISSGTVKLILEDLDDISALSITIDTVPVRHWESLCTDRRAGRYEVNLRLPEGSGPGIRHLSVRRHQRLLARVEILITTTSGCSSSTRRPDEEGC